MRNIKNTSNIIKVILTISLLCIPFINAQAFTWQDLWLRPDQQGMRALDQGKGQQASKLFQNSQWQGVADYRAGDYKQAAQAFAKENTVLSSYNLGNALAYQQQYQQAIQAYDKALKQDPNFTDAKYNKELLEKLLKKQKQQQQKNQSQNKDQNKNKNQKNSQQNQKNQKNQQSKSSSNQQQNNQNQAKNKNQSQQQNQQQQNQNQSQQNNQQNKNQKQPQQQQNQQAQDKQQNKKSSGKPQQTMASQQQQQQTNQQVQQWLRQIPDNPGGLLRQKFLRDHWKLQQENRAY